MRIAVVHYHTRPGGVTRVIEHSISILSNAGHQVAVLTGSADASFESAHLIEGLNYQDPPIVRAGQLLDQMKKGARDVLGGPPDVWHFHNHSIGKNLALCEAVHLLAEQKERLILQIHDFPEDSRPINYQRLLRWAGDKESLGKQLYPQAAQIHYALLNERDRQFLLSAGARPDGLHLLPNPVYLSDAIPQNTATSSQERMFLYPTRAIRRKNVGELLLWAVLAEPGDRFVLTLAPTSPEDRPGYERWINLARDLKLPVEFEAGLRGRTLGEMLSQCHAVLTTSIAEGFGLAFLEPWLADRMLTGRNLPEITGEFAREGIDLTHLYQRLLVPLAWIGKADYESAVQLALTRWMNAFQRPLRDDSVARAVSAATDNDRVDFARLDEAQQERVIRMLHSARDARGDIQQPLMSLPDKAKVKQNRHTVESKYNLRQYGERLLNLYEIAANSVASPIRALSAERLLVKFLNPERFYLLRS